MAHKTPLHGILRYTPNEGFELEVLGSFLELPKLLQGPQNLEIIQGISSDGKNITLYKCFHSKAEFGSPSIGPQGIRSIRYKPSRIFIGAHFNGDPVFKSIIINYTHLDEWVNLSGFEIPMPSEDRELLIKYKMPKDIPINLDEKYDLAITHSSEGPNLSLVQKESCIKQLTYIKIESKKENPIDEYDNIISKIRNFLSFGVGKPVYPLTISGMTNDYENVEIYYNNSEIPGTYKPMIPSEMFFCFKDISETLETVIRNWFNRSEVLAPVFDLYFGNIYTHGLYLETRFLYAAQAIESYHRRKETTVKYESLSDEHDARIASIISSAPIKHKEWLNAKLKYSNEVTLSRRLRDIISLYKEIAEIYIGNNHEQKDFIYKVITTRNYLTHFDKDAEINRSKGKELLIIIEKLKILIKACLLGEIGIDYIQVKTILERYKSHSFMAWVK